MSITFSALRSSTLPAIKEALHSFSSIPSQKFRLITSYPPRDPQQPQFTVGKKLCVLDSSFNPPTRAHLHLALSAVQKYSISSTSSQLEPPDLLLLLATQNVDKPSTPASFEDRLAMMCLLADEIRSNMNGQHAIPRVDIGVTSHARFIDKSSILSTSPPYGEIENGQVWIMGYDTLTRLLDPKYYENHSLVPLYDTVLGGKNRVMMMLRQSKTGGWGSMAEQSEYVKGLDEKAISKIDIAVAERECEGVSSSEIRSEIKKGNVDRWKSCTCEKIAEYIEERKLYVE